MQSTAFSEMTENLDPLICSSYVLNHGNKANRVRGGLLAVRLARLHLVQAMRSLCRRRQHRLLGQRIQRHTQFVALRGDRALPPVRLLEVRREGCRRQAGQQAWGLEGE